MLQKRLLKSLPRGFEIIGKSQAGAQELLQPLGQLSWKRRTSQYFNIIHKRLRQKKKKKDGKFK